VCRQHCVCWFSLKELLLHILINYISSSRSSIKKTLWLSFTKEEIFFLYYKDKTFIPSYIASGGRQIIWQEGKMLKGKLNSSNYFWNFCLRNIIWGTDFFSSTHHTNVGWNLICALSAEKKSFFQGGEIFMFFTPKALKYEFFLAFNFVNPRWIYYID